VDYSAHCPGLVIAKPVYQYTRATFVRKSVAEMLNKAVAALPKGYRLGIIEGWRPRYIQRRMYVTQWARFKKLHPDWSDVQLRRVVNRFTHPADSRVPPPHSSGGAVDVMVVDEAGERLDHSSPYKVFDPRNYPAAAQGLSETAERNRAILREALEASGMTNYPSEYWHWSHGDQGWAYRGGHPQAIYGPIDAPEGWRPVPEDDLDEPLVRMWGADAGSGFPRLPGSESE
jgi:D-alanyl-D-alanine dipeptidase